MEFIVEDPIFKTEPLFVLGVPWERFALRMKRHYRVPDVGVNPEKAVGVTGTMLTFEHPPWRVVWTRDRDLPVALHEIFHLVTRICQDKGIPIVAHTDHGCGDETAAYLFEFFARHLIRRLR